MTEILADLDWNPTLRVSADLSKLTDEQIAALEEFRRFSSYLPSDDQVNVKDGDLDEEDFFVSKLLSKKDRLKGTPEEDEDESSDEDLDSSEEDIYEEMLAQEEKKKLASGDERDVDSSGNELEEERERSGSMSAKSSKIQLVQKHPSSASLSSMASSPPVPTPLPQNTIDFRSLATRAQHRITMTPEELRERTLSVLTPDPPKNKEEVTIKHHSKKYHVHLYTQNQKSERKYLLDVSVQGIRIRTKEKALVRFFDLEVIETIRLRKLPSGEHIMEIDFLRLHSTGIQNKYGRVILLTDQGKAIVKELNAYKPKIKRKHRKTQQEAEKAVAKEARAKERQEKRERRERREKAKEEKREKERAEKAEKEKADKADKAERAGKEKAEKAEKAEKERAEKAEKEKEKAEKAEKEKAEKEKEKAEKGEEKLRKRRSTKSKGSKDLPLNQVFGVPLEKALAASRVEGFLPHEDVPTIVRRCIEFIESNGGLEDEGIYRLSGSVSVIKSLKDQFDRGLDVNWDDYAADNNCAASLLKQYLRELPESVFSDALDSKFNNVAMIQDTAQRLQQTAYLMHQIPIQYYALMNVVIGHLKRIEARNEQNKMTLKNLGIVFVPTLKIPPQIFLLLFEHFDIIFTLNPSFS